MPITKYENQTFKQKVFVLEECWFVNCVLRECTLFYSGGTYDWENTNVEPSCQWKFHGPARMTFELFRLIGLITAQPAPPVQPPKNSGPVN
jgi:hypothetical protein